MSVRLPGLIGRLVGLALIGWLGWLIGIALVFGGLFGLVRLIHWIWYY